MSAIDRQNRLLLAEDWKRIYQTFRNADFQSYDFENLRRTMIDYIRANYPENFNDYIESSEYLALIDLIAFLGQNIAFRVDLNARENFLELAERRDSILRTARMLSYNPKRNIPAQGLLKFVTVQTSENILDSNGRNLSGQVITWNDSSNPNWRDQFIKVLNSALSIDQQYGNPIDRANIYGIPTEQYRFQASNTDVPIYSFSKLVSSRSMSFEITSTTFKGQEYIYEEAPKVGNKLAFLYSDDGQGPGGPNTGFFLNMVQGILNVGSFTISQPSTNESVDIETQGINNNDVWLYKLDQNGVEIEDWTQVPNLEGNNIIYNSLNKNIRNIYSVITRAGDAITLSFSDGTFGNLPSGTFRTYYRISNGLSYVINPQDIRSVAITIPYISHKGNPESISITLNLASSIVNASPSETNDSIKANAPAAYYTQNRMITGEDYNISPLTVNQQVAKIKAVNRTSSGISRYFDLIDPTGKYSSTKLFGTDGVLYKENYIISSRFPYSATTDVETIIYNKVFDILDKPEVKYFYYSKFLQSTSDILRWNAVFLDSNMSSGYITNSTGIIQNIGDTSSVTFLKYFKNRALVKFIAPAGMYFDTNNLNNLVRQVSPSAGMTSYVWAEIVAVDNNGLGVNNTGIRSNGEGAIQISKPIPNEASISHVIPKWTTSLTTSTVGLISDLIKGNKPFGLRYDIPTQSWKIIYEADLAIKSAFSLQYTGNTSKSHLDASWFLLFTTDNEFYTIRSRELKYVFESDKEIEFYFDRSNKIYDTRTSKIVKDIIKVLGINTKSTNSVEPFAVDFEWEVISEYVGSDGYYDGKKVIIGFADADDNGIVDNPEIFNDITNLSDTIVSSIGTVSDVITGRNGTTISPWQATVVDMTTTNGLIVGSVITATNGTGRLGDLGVYAVISINSPTSITYQGIGGYEPKKGSITNIAVSLSSIIPLQNKFIIQQKYFISQGQEDYRYVSNVDKKVIIFSTETQSVDFTKYDVGQHFYFIDIDTVKVLDNSKNLVASLDYKVFSGRSDLKFEYTHSADYEARIDPGVSNIIDIYVLTKSYDVAFRQWLSGAITNRPLPPGTGELYNMLSPKLNLIKSISDEIIYHPVSYKILFGATATEDVQASFKVIKTPGQVISDNDIKARVIIAINQFFELENWDFGDTFYFTELATFVMNRLAPDISNFVIVPRQSGLNFGSLFEIKSSSDQLFINGATVDDIEIIAGITMTNIKSVSNTTIDSTLLTQSVITSSSYGDI